MHLKNVVITYKSRILKFKIQQKVFYKKRCGIIRLNVLNFLDIYEKPLFKGKNSQKPKIIGFFEKVEKIACFWHFIHPKSELSLV